VAEHREAVRQLLERVFDGESGTIRFEIVGLRGGRRWLDMFLSPRRDGSGAIMPALTISRDLTSRRQVEAAGAASGRMLRMVMDNIPQGVFWKDRQCRNGEAASRKSTVHSSQPRPFVPEHTDTGHDTRGTACAAATATLQTAELSRSSRPFRSSRFTPHARTHDTRLAPVRPQGHVVPAG
jgi:PAS domain-containing protein